MPRTFAVWSVIALWAMAVFVRADELSQTPPNVAASAAAATQAAAEDARREQAIAEYTQKMKDANYPALFDKAAQEFNVPPDVLKAVSFAETRWTQLEWPAGETVSPENGMPHAYGIMSLWDNDYFGHTLAQAAQLIGQDPDVLKTDVFQNMRGGAALLRQIYDQTPKPSDAPSENQIESWRKAIAKYTGIPQAELSEAHALRVYEYMKQGYHQYGIEWDAHPVNLQPMRDDVARIRSAALEPKAVVAQETQPQPSTTSTPMSLSTPLVTPIPPAPIIAAAPAPSHGQDEAANVRQRWFLGGLMLVLLVIAAKYLHAQKRNIGKNSESN